MSGKSRGDGFTEAELNAVVQPSAAPWSPSEDYDEKAVGSLEVGPGYVTFKGRVVHLYDQPRASNKGKGTAKGLEAKGCLKMMVADDTGAVTVRLWYAQVQYKPHLGQLVTVWTVHISQGTAKPYLTSKSAPYFTSIFPERERSCHVTFHDGVEDDGSCYKHPYGSSGQHLIPGLMTLREFRNGGYDVAEAKLLICVKSIRARTTRQHAKSGQSYELINVRVFDDTEEGILTLHDIVCHSASKWQPCHTILLISEPRWSIDGIAKLSVNANTRIDVDPDMEDAHWLRTMAQRLMKREHVNPPFPAGVFDTEAAETAPVRILYTLADIDEFARANPKERCMGYISVILTEPKFVLNYKRNMLMSTECCGNPIYANALTAKCPRCEKHIPLRINPRIIGPVIDETGQIASGKLVLSDSAWTQLLGRTAAQLLRDDVDVLGYLEQRMLFLRVTMGFAWGGDGSHGTAAGGGAEGQGQGKWERKRKRVDVFAGKGNERVGERKEGKGPNVEKKEKQKSEGMVSSVGEVGRLCIWCVKM